MYVFMCMWMWVKMEDLGDHRCQSSLVLTIQLLRYLILTHTHVCMCSKYVRIRHVCNVWMFTCLVILCHMIQGSVPLHLVTYTGLGRIPPTITRTIHKLKNSMKRTVCSDKIFIPLSVIKHGSPANPPFIDDDSSNRIFFSDVPATFDRHRRVNWVNYDTRANHLNRPRDWQSKRSIMPGKREFPRNAVSSIPVAMRWCDGTSPNEHELNIYNL